VSTISVNHLGMDDDNKQKTLSQACKSHRLHAYPIPTSLHTPLLGAFHHKTQNGIVAPWDKHPVLLYV